MCRVKKGGNRLYNFCINLYKLYLSLLILRTRSDAALYVTFLLDFACPNAHHLFFSWICQINFDSFWILKLVSQIVSTKKK